MANGVRVARRHVRIGVVTGFERPLAEQFLAELAQLERHARLGVGGGAVVTDGLVEHIGNLMQAGEQCRPLREALLQ